MANTTTGRQWSMVNEDKKHYASKQPVGFKVSLQTIGRRDSG